MNKRDTDKIKKIGPNVERLWSMLFQHGGERGFFDIHDSCTVHK